MYISPLQDIDNVPSLGAMIGSVRSPDVLEQINAKWGSNTVAFGMPNHPFAEHYKHFMNLVNGQLAHTDQVVMSTVEAVMNPNQFKVIQNETDLALVPPCMQIPLLMMPQMYELAMEGKIWCWGYEPASLPTEDAYGRILSNGKVEWDPRDPSTLSEYITWEWKQDDPDLTDEQWEAIEKSRKWLADWIENEMSGGERRDPTDLGNVISV